MSDGFFSTCKPNKITGENAERYINLFQERLWEICRKKEAGEHIPYKDAEELAYSLLQEIYQ